MKLVIAAEIFPPDIGGPATYSSKLAEQLTKIGWQVKVICYSDKIENDNYPFSVARILRSTNPLKHYFNYFWELLKLAKDCDVIYAQGPVSSGLPAIVAGFFLSKKVVVKVVGDYAWEQARNSGQTDIGIDEFQKQKLTGKVAWLKKIEIFSCRYAKKVIVPSQYLKGIVSGWGVPADKIEVVYNANEVENLGAAKSVNENLIISVGRLVPWKGFEVLIDVMSDLLAKNKDFKLLILGSGPQKDKLISLVGEFNLQNNVSIKEVEKSRVISQLSLAAVFILNSGYEGLSHTILEAMLAGTPVIATDIGGNPELIKDGENGLLVEYNNKEQLKQAILKLYNNPELRHKFVENSKEVLKKFTFENMINKTINVLKSIPPR